mmetsp:Transcript_21568/g.73976  ORF Transcript_21568/g.73976 Transcript_21568/m.73976 type:complete len:206 (+) Transcript_21568:1383-2000(+)
MIVLCTIAALLRSPFATKRSFARRANLKASVGSCARLTCASVFSVAASPVPWPDAWNAAKASRAQRSAGSASPLAKCTFASTCSPAASPSASPSARRAARASSASRNACSVSSFANLASATASRAAARLLLSAASRSLDFAAARCSRGAREKPSNTAANLEELRATGVKGPGACSRRRSPAPRLGEASVAGMAAVVPPPSAKRSV